MKTLHILISCQQSIHHNTPFDQQPWLPQVTSHLPKPSLAPQNCSALTPCSAQTNSYHRTTLPPHPSPPRSSSFRTHTLLPPTRAERVAPATSEVSSSIQKSSSRPRAICNATRRDALRPTRSVSVGARSRWMERAPERYGTKRFGWNGGREWKGRKRDTWHGDPCLVFGGKGKHQ